MRLLNLAFYDICTFCITNFSIKNFFKSITVDNFIIINKLFAMLSNRVGFTGVCLYSNTPLLKHIGTAVQNTLVNHSRFDSTANNGYNIDVSSSTDSSILLDPGTGLASTTPPLLKCYWWLLMMEGLGLTVQRRVVQPELPAAPLPYNKIMAVIISISLT